MSEIILGEKRTCPHGYQTCKVCEELRTRALAANPFRESTGYVSEAEVLTPRIGAIQLTPRRSWELNELGAPQGLSIRFEDQRYGTEHTWLHLGTVHLRAVKAYLDAVDQQVAATFALAQIRRPMPGHIYRGPMERERGRD